jgi:hypothetical protein
MIVDCHVNVYEDAQILPLHLEVTRFARAEAVELPPAASSPAPAAPGWPAPAELVAHLASDDDYLDEVVSALLANPDATRVFLAKLGPLKSLLLGA